MDATDHRAAAANLPPVDSVDMSGLIMGTNSTRPRTELAIGTEPAVSNITTAPPCASYSWSPQYDDPAWQLPVGDNCTTVSAIIVDDADGLWKLITGDEKQYVTTGPHYPNSTTNFNSQDPQWTGHCANGCTTATSTLFWTISHDDFSSMPPRTRRELSCAMVRDIGRTHANIKAQWTLIPPKIPIYPWVGVNLVPMVIGG